MLVWERMPFVSTWLQLEMIFRENSLLEYIFYQLTAKCFIFFKQNQVQIVFVFEIMISTLQVKFHTPSVSLF